MSDEGGLTVMLWLVAILLALVDLIVWWSGRVYA